MIDAGDRNPPRFPAALEAGVRAAIESEVDRLLPLVGYSQAACGSDILFCESLLERGQECNIVLPFARDDYIEASVACAGQDWIARFERVMAAATSVTFRNQGNATCETTPCLSTCRRSFREWLSCVPGNWRSNRKCWSCRTIPSAAVPAAPWQPSPTGCRRAWRTATSIWPGFVARQRLR